MRTVIAVVAVVQTVLIATVPVEGSLVLSWLVATAWLTAAVWHIRPATWGPVRSTALLVLGIPVAAVAAVVVMLLFSLPTGYDSAQTVNPAASLAFSLATLLTLLLWAGSLWRRPVRSPRW